MPRPPESVPPVRNRIGFRHRLARLQGSTIDLDLQAYERALAFINDRERHVRSMPDAALAPAARELHARYRDGPSGWSERAGMFALAREVARRALGMRPYDVQVVAALALDAGNVVEMQTGEGKTLAAVLTAAWNALGGAGVHVLTFDDYLATRDADWMGPAYGLLGLSVAHVDQRMAAAARRRAYRADVTYVTAKEAGFDYLRDLLARDRADLDHRPFHMAIVDEADSLLIDEGRVPLVIAGHVERRDSNAALLAGMVRALRPDEHFSTDEYANDVELTDGGIEQAERALGCGSLHAQVNLHLLTELQCALHAQALLRRDVDYIVRDGRVELVDELTGRVVPDRHRPDGLQAALEAKEGIARSSDGRILGIITMQHFMARYPRLCGMTGTAQGAAAELFEAYGLRVAVIPTHRSVRRVDHADVVFADRDTKEQALMDEITRAHAAGRPILVGTASVEESERLASRLSADGVACDVLNAKNDEREAEIVAQAGSPGAVTISTNMAGRGTDIRLGGADESERDRVIAAGGLYVIGTSHHENRRVDLQLRGRAGRQGDPGESRFFVSLEDDLMLRYRLRDLLAGRVLTAGTGPVENPIVRAEIARVQRIVEGQHFEIRRTLRRYADVLERQRQNLMARREAVLSDADDWRVWPDDPSYAGVAAAVGEPAACEAERLVTLGLIDRVWRDHLSLCADVREGIHLVTLGGLSPLGQYTSQMIAAYTRAVESLDEVVLDICRRLRIVGARLDLSGHDIKGPSSTWTYVVNDDPFRNHIARLLTGPGNATIAVYAATVLTPLLVLWGIVERLRVRRRK